jgi:hypothetical protein
MINSLMSRMGEAQKLSIPQLQKAIQDGTLPPYVGIPLLQDKMKQQQAAQASQQQPQQPPIAQQVMQEASMHDRGVEALPSNLPTEEMYDGGIVAFAEGDLVDDQTVEDYQDQAEEDEDTQNLQAALENSAEANEGIGAIPNAGTGLKYTEPVPAGASKGIDADLSRKHNVGNLRPVGFKYEGQIGTSPGGFAMFDSRESGIKALNHDISVKLERGLNTPEKFLNVYAPKGDKNDTEAYIRNVSKALNIKPNQEIPNTPEAKMILAQAITRQEGSDKATARFAEGGIIGLAGGGLNPITGMQEPDYSDENTPSISQTLGNIIGNPTERIGNSIQGVGFQSNKEVQQAGEKTAQKEAQSKMKYETKDQMGPTDSELKGATTVNTSPSSSANNIQSGTTNTPIDPYQALMDKLDAKDADAKKQRTIDGYMGLLTAGLGMMGGSSPYAMENIGKGALAGVQQYGESRKLSASQEANRDKTMATLLRGQTSANLANQTNQRLSGQYAQTQEDKQQLFHSNAYNTINKEIDAAAKARIAANPSLQGDPAAYDKIVAQLRQQQLPILKQHYKGFMGTDMPDTDSAGSSNVIKFDSSGKPIK